MDDAKKSEIWTHMLLLPKSFRGHGLTDKRLERLKTAIWNDPDFWTDIIRRHGLDRKSITTLKETDEDTYSHCVGNFWSMLYQDAISTGIIKLIR